MDLPEAVGGQLDGDEDATVMGQEEKRREGTALGQVLPERSRGPQTSAPGVEGRLLVEAAAGEREAVKWLLDVIAPVVYGYLFARVGGDEAVAEDLLQETLLEAVRGARAFRGESSVTTWMCAIARRRLARYYETERRADVARSSLRLVRAPVGVPGDLGGAGGPGAVERQDEVVRALGKLPSLQRQAIVLKYMDDLPVSEVARRLDRTPVQVQSLLQRGRDGLRRYLGGSDE